MKIGNLEFKPIIKNQNMVPKCIYDFVKDWDNKEEKEEFMVAEINPDYKDGNMLCEEYNIDKKIGFNCLIVECKRNEIKKYCALIVPIGYKYNMGSVVRKYTNSRVVSVADLNYVLEKTNMELWTRCRTLSISSGQRPERIIYALCPAWLLIKISTEWDTGGDFTIVFFLKWRRRQVL